MALATLWLSLADERFSGAERMADTAATRTATLPAAEIFSARDRLIRAASELFCRHGINATGVDAVVDAAGTAKATLYKVFGSKEGLIEAVLVEEGRAWREWFLAEIDAYPGGPLDKLAGSLAVLEGWFEREHFFGCPFINAVGEFDKNDDRYKAIALAHKQVVMAHLLGLATDGGCRDPEATAHQIGILIDGAIVAAMITGNPLTAKFAHEAAVRILAGENQSATR